MFNLKIRLFKETKEKILSCLVIIYTISWPNIFYYAYAELIVDLDKNDNKISRVNFGFSIILLIVCILIPIFLVYLKWTLNLE